jgi:O-antigen ligase/tetratricopeptide (TPR) repeat protein
MQSMNTISFSLFIFLLIFSPLAFGTVEPWSLALMETVSFSAIALLLFKNLRDSNFTLYKAPGILPLCLLLFSIVFQLIPLPPAVIRVIAPSTYDLYQNTLFVFEPGQWITLTIHKKATLIEFFRIASYAAFYLLTVQLLAKKETLTRTIMIIVLFASVLSFFSILQHILSNSKIYWIRELTLGGSLFGPYVNRNHYAGFMEMLFPLILSLFLFYKPHVRYNTFREKMAAMFNLRKTNIYLLLGFGAVLTATSIFLTLSRTGIVSLCLSLVFFGGMFLLKGTDKKRGIIIIAISILVVLSVGWFGWDPIFERFEKIRTHQGDIAEQRLAYWKDSWNSIKEFPVFGTGFGSYQYIYPRYRTISGDAVLDHAHNDYIELLSNGGFIFLILGVWFLFEVIFRSYSTFLKRHEMYSRYIFIAGITGIIAILLHSITDFNLQIGANGLYFSFLLGLTVSAANTRLREGLNDTYLKREKFPVRTMIVLASLLALSCFIYQSGVVSGKVFFSPVKDTKLSGKLSHEEILSVRDKATRATLLDPLEAGYFYTLANAEKLLSNTEEAVGYYKKTVCLNPTNGEYLQRLGLILSEQGNDASADTLFRAGIAYDISNPSRYKRYALWLFSQGKKDEGIGRMKQAIALEPQKTRDSIALMVLAGLQDDEIEKSLPERAEPYILFARYLHQTNNDVMAEQAYQSAFKYLLRKEPVSSAYFKEIHAFYMKNNRFESALAIMQKAREIFPNDAGIRLAAGDAYEKAGIRTKAIDEYRAALVLEPKNREAQRRLDALLTKDNKP